MYNISGETHTSVSKKARNPVDRDVHGNKDLLKLHCDLYHHHYILLCH